MTRTLRASATLVLAAAGLVGASAAASAACNAPTRAYNQYADQIDAIFADGFESGDVSAVHNATQTLAQHVAGYTATDDLWKLREAAVQQMIAAMGTEVVVYVRLQEAADHIGELREPACP